MAKITYGTKTGTVPKQTHANQWWDDDANEVKTVVNNNWIKGFKLIEAGALAGYYVNNGGADRSTVLTNDVIMGAGGLWGGDFVIAKARADNPTTEVNFYVPYVRAGDVIPPS